MLALRDLPNALTLGRMLLVGPLVYLLLSGSYDAALVVALVVGISDWLDGALARRFGWQSEFGGMLDPLADKLLMVSVFAALTWMGVLPIWLLVLVIARDLVIVAGGIAYHYRVERFHAAPTRLSKANTACQVVLMWVVLTRLAGLAVPAAVVDGLVVLVAALVVTTMLQYVVVWGRRARAHLGDGGESR